MRSKIVINTNSMLALHDIIMNVLDNVHFTIIAPNNLISMEYSGTKLCVGICVGGLICGWGLPGPLTL